MDMAGNENMPLHDSLLEGFRKARELGLHVTVHAGEAGPAANIREAIDDLGAERIGHGYQVMDDEDIYMLARERGIHFEVLSTQLFSQG